MSDILCPFMPKTSNSISMYDGVPVVTATVTQFGTCQRTCIAHKEYEGIQMCLRLNSLLSLQPNPELGVMHT